MKLCVTALLFIHLLVGLLTFYFQNSLTHLFVKMEIKLISMYLFRNNNIEVTINIRI